jgi:hypothetical protein
MLTSFCRETLQVERALLRTLLERALDGSVRSTKGF